MLPWNPPSSFSLGSEQGGLSPQQQPPQQQQQQPPRYSPYQQEQPAPHQQPGQPQPSPPQQQQQQREQQQPNAAAQGPPPSAALAPYPPMTLAATLHFLQSEHRRYARDRNEWEIERAEMRARIALLEGEKRGSEGALKSLGRRCKMLEMALRGERSKFLSTTNALPTGAAGGTPAMSGTSSPIPGLPSGKDATLASAIPPAKLAALQKDAPATPGSPVGQAKEEKAAAEKKPEGEAAKDGAGAEKKPETPERKDKTDTLAAPAAIGNGFNTGTWSGTMSGMTMGALGSRDPRGKARSREYLKQCLQEITYLTSSTTLNPLSAHSYAAPSVARPRKVLPDHVPQAGAGVLNLSPPASSAPAGISQTGELAPLAGASVAAEEKPTVAAAPVAPQMEKESSQQKALLTSFPSDPPSAFVPLKRTISQPGQASARGAQPAQPVPSAPAPVSVPEVRVDGMDEAEAAEMDREIAALAGEPSAVAPVPVEAERAPDENEQEAASLGEDGQDDVSSATPVAEAIPEEQLQPAEDVQPEPLLESEESVMNAAPGAGSEKAVAPESADGEAQETQPSAGEDASPAAASDESPASDEAPADEPASEESDLLAQAEHATPEVEDEKPSDEDVDVVEASASSAPSADEEVEGEQVARKEGEQEQDGDKAETVEEKDESEELLPASSSSGGGNSSGAANGGSDAGGRDGGVLLSAGGSEGSRWAEDEEEIVTAIYRGDTEEWRAKLKEAGRRAYPSLAAASSGGGGGGDKELENLEWDLDASSSSDEASLGKKGKGKRGGRREKQRSEDTVGLGESERFKPRRVLKSHLEAVRAVVVHGQESVEVVSAGDDCTVKLWRGAVGKEGSRSDLEPTITFRGHTAPVTALAVSPSSAGDGPATIFSGSLDGTIRLWRSPPAGHSIYDPFDPSLALGVLESGADAVWGLALVAAGSQLAAITADGSVQLWSVPDRVLLQSWDYGAPDVSSPAGGLGSSTGSGRKRPVPPPTPTALAVLRDELEAGKGAKEYLAVAFQNAVVKVFEPESGLEVSRLDASETSDGSPDTQINALAVFPALGILATGHEDRFIRVFDYQSGKLLVSTTAHLDGVTSLFFSSSPSSPSSPLLASTSHDASFRLWSLFLGPSPSLTCVQEASTHRIKGAEGALAVAFSGDGMAAVTAGADGTVRVWEK
ncbi:hypothetical protein JCM10213_008978 [Rhodosporidiobolus nylandii]